VSCLLFVMLQSFVKESWLMEATTSLARVGWNIVTILFISVVLQSSVPFFPTSFGSRYCWYVSIWLAE